MKFHEKRFAREYDTRLTAENYPGLLLEKILDKLQTNSTVIDCGAGSGFFAIPLARMGYKITAVEPSVPMLDILKEKLVESIQDKPADMPISIVNQSWEDYAGEGANYCICVHAIYPMVNPKKALLKMRELCGNTILIARDNNHASSTITDRIRDRLKIETSYKRNEVDVAGLLQMLNIKFTPEKVDQKRISKFSDMDAETEYYAYHLKIPQTSLNKIKEVLTDLATETEKGYEIEQTYHDIIYIF